MHLPAPSAKLSRCKQPGGQAGMSGIFASGGTAVITGAASGIGRAAAIRLSRLGMRLCLFDTDRDLLQTVAGELGTDTVIVAGDVSVEADIARLHDAAYEAFGTVTLLMNNAAIGGNSTSWGAGGDWKRILEVNLHGVLHGVQRFVPSMLEQPGRSAIVNTGSKQGITNPPGNPAYAVAKAGVRTLSEQLAHALREQAGDRVTAHLLVPGWTFTGMTRRGIDEKPDGAWTSGQVVELMVDRVDAGDFYILCPDNAVTPEVDAKRIRWGADDLVCNRPALSRWHPDWKDRFETFMAGPKL
jgi:NAD(P)-dependent dehydrogenase (short-subunit alcohol dehydrogenase family)